MHMRQYLDDLREQEQREYPSKPLNKAKKKSWTTSGLPLGHVGVHIRSVFDGETATAEVVSYRTEVPTMVRAMANGDDGEVVEVVKSAAIISSSRSVVERKQYIEQIKKNVHSHNIYEKD
ncbi:hypothetical protein PV325_011398 [Microctonus aethiopoides]|nr:hypothetical protein PV325_011398 [Microctonus aethiopoides]